MSGPGTGSGTNGTRVDTVGTVPELRARTQAWRDSGLRIALVPTMGALHEGHLSLIRRAAALADKVVVSIFVNPIQFGPNEDFAKYPRQLDRDRASAGAAGAALIYAPAVDDMYPEDFCTTVVVGGPSQGLCGAARPGHFEGVATVVAKLFLQCLPDVAVFGEKDYQQLQVIRRLVRDLDIPIRIEGAPTVREPDGLAMSSRNAYLSPEQRATAAGLYRILTETAEALRAGTGVREACERAAKALKAAGFTKLDYCELRDARSLEPLDRLDRPARLLAAVFLGQTRLIDNVPVDPPGESS